ncbi:uncharacterized protein LOC144548857 [Carex rostrata]
MAGNFITYLLSVATNLLPSITASAHAPSSSSNSNNSEKERACAAEEELERLMRTLKWIKATMYDAEDREIIDCSVKFWLKELKKVAFDAEDVLSEYQYEVTRVQVEARNTSEASGFHKRKQIEYIVPIPIGIVDRLDKIRRRFDEIATDHEALQLRESDGVRRPNNKILRPPTGHMVDEANIFGRDADISKVIDFLLTEKEKSLSVISIVGKGGLGKTTIAQLIYKDERVSRCFDLNGWVCVSEEFDVRRLSKATIESFSKKKCDLSEFSQLQEELAKIVKGKTILLVLDDVWNENHNLWESFRVPLKEARMVRILVTTRNKKVAKVMQTTSCFNPSNLSEYSCWQLFQHYAFSGTSDTMPIHLVDMGREITRKCGGLPLAVKSIASLLRHEADEEGWREILESDLWENKESKEVIFPALQISYAHLPAHLKPCFLFCSMYPKDYTLKQMDLIKLWIAHGYIESRSNRNIIEIGVEYYNELKERSFLEYENTFFKKEYCKLHDIIHDLARLNSENEHYSVENNQPLDILERIVLREAHHLYVRGFMRYVNQIPQHMNGLRTIFMDMPECNADVDCVICTNCKDYVSQGCDSQDCLEDVTLCNPIKFEVLRVLILQWDCLGKFPHSISGLKHLTYLRIRSLRLKMLPLSIDLLYNLLSLEIDCFSLEYLPENIGHLANLQFLTISSDVYLKKLPQSFGSLTKLLELIIDTANDLEYVPHGLVNFPSIKTFSAMLNVRTIGWLKDMKDLEGKITFYDLKNFRNLEDAKRANLRNKHKLEILELLWEYEFMGLCDTQTELALFVKIPSDVGRGAKASCNMREAESSQSTFTLCEVCGIPGESSGMVTCPKCKNTCHPPCTKFEETPHKDGACLKWCCLRCAKGKQMAIPEIREMHKRVEKEKTPLPRREVSFPPEKERLLADLLNEYLEDEIVGTDDIHFSLLECLQPHPNLKELRVEGYPSAIVPGWMRDPSVLQSIQQISLENCCYIQSLPFGYLHTFKKLTIHNCSSIRVIQLEQLPSQLKILYISWCYHLELITGLEHLNMLETLDIRTCGTLKSLTMDGLQLVESTELFGEFSHELTHINRQSISSLTKLVIENCGSLHSLPDGLIPPGPCYVDVHGCGCPDFEKSIQETSISHHTSMSNIDDDVEDEGEDDDSDDDKSN